MDIEIEKAIIELKNSRDSLISSALQLDKIVKEKQAALEKSEESLNNIKKIIYNDKITGIEAKLMIKDLLEKGSDKE